MKPRYPADTLKLSGVVGRQVPQAQAVRKATAAALAQQKPAAAPAAMPRVSPAMPAAAPKVSTAGPAAAAAASAAAAKAIPAAAKIAPAAPAVPAEQVPAFPAALKRAHFSAYAENFTLAVEEGAKLFLPVEARRAEGGLGVAEGVVTAPEDGYYMLLWELGVGGAQGAATLQLGINEAASQLTYALHPGYDSGQQVTWLSAGDKVGLFIQAEDDEAKAEVQCTSAQFTVIRLG
ncbi:MAG: hypothetical protein FWE98_07465 [Oscillospiraceae bacterium]|nr:hypothetical protein [Oscillospiraceae bacterium]